MNETLNTIKNRRSTRKFNNKEISEDILNQILEAGTYAPTGMNKQSPIIICIKDKKIRNEIIKENARIGGWKEGFDPFYGAPIIILVIAKNIGHVALGYSDEKTIVSKSLKDNWIYKI